MNYERCRIANERLSRDTRCWVIFKMVQPSTREHNISEGTYDAGEGENIKNFFHHENCTK